MNTIKEHFESEAKEFDNIIIKLIPYYDQMINALINAIPFDNNAAINIIDLGCGTGTIAKRISERFPNANIVCLDIAANMIEMAKIKLKNHTNTEYITGDFSNIEFNSKYNVVISSLALHHLENDDDKIKFYTKIFSLLNKNGVFYNADVVLGASDNIQQMYMNRWVEYMERSVSKDEITNNWIPKYKAEDRPARLIDQINWLHDIGFNSIDVIWKYYNFSVYGGTKG